MKRLVVGLLAHVDSGKTTLAEGLLYRAGVLRKLGRVDHRDAFLDTDSRERARGITIFAKQAVLALPAAAGAEACELTLLDTPGHVDFSAEAERALQVLDYAVLVVSGTDGVQAHTETLWKLLARYRVPTFVFVNKMDLPGADAAVRLRELRGRFGKAVVFGTLQGANRARLRELGAPGLKSYGTLQALPRDTLDRLLAQLLEDGYLVQTGDQYAVLRLGDITPLKELSLIHI